MEKKLDRFRLTKNKVYLQFHEIEWNNNDGNIKYEKVV